ncbi:stress-activated map kinase interacting protein 1-domain-containing protein [Sporodiniella umbellata]|nr:stress-activated map kinase interacting protein 1-domain-containing protein [Sporodiniella umbellata]
MSLITDPLYLIHISRIKLLRIDERGERIVSFPPNVLSDDYVRLAAPVYPEMQYCYSPTYDSYLNETKLMSSPHTNKRNYRSRNQKAPFPIVQTAKADISASEEEETEPEKQKKQDGEPTSALNPAEEILLDPSVDSAIDPSPRSSLNESNLSAFPFPDSAQSEIDQNQEHKPASASINSSHLLEYTKKIIYQPQKSALSALIAEKATTAENPFAEYSYVSGKGENKPITLCVYLPHSNQPYEPVSIIVRPDALIDDVIGYILYDYVEQKRGKELDAQSLDLAEWVLLIAEDDGEIEEDLPAVDRTRRIDRVSFDQFALCRATPSQVKQNDATRAKMGKSKPDVETLRKKKEVSEPIPDLAIPSSPENATAVDQETTNGPLLHNQPTQVPDASTVAVPVPSSKATLTKATLPMTPLKYFRLRLMTNEEVSATTSIPAYAEMFIGDVLELVSRKRKLDPNEYMLTIADTNVIVPNDTTVENMKGITDLALVKKERAMSIPTSNHLWRSPMKRKKDELNYPMYFSSDASQKLTSANTNDGLLSQYKKYSVGRKMPMFVSKKMYILAIDGDYIHLMPPEHKGMFDSVKTTSFYASAIRSCKQSKKVPTDFKLIVLKERDYKTYDLEAESSKEAYEICARIRFLMQVTKGA